MAGQQGYGATFSWEGTVIAAVESFNGPNDSTEKVDVSALDSPGQVIEKLAGWIDSGDLSMVINYKASTQTTHKTITTAKAARTIGACIVTFADGSALNFSAFIDKFAPKVPLKGKVTADFGVCVTGPITYPS